MHVFRFNIVSFDILQSLICKVTGGPGNSWGSLGKYLSIRRDYK